VFFRENEARHANNWKRNYHKLNVIRSVCQTRHRVTYEIDSLAVMALRSMIVRKYCFRSSVAFTREDR